MRLSSIALAATLAIPVTAISSPCASIEFQTVKNLSIQQIGQFSTERSEYSGQHVLILRGFDSEDRPRRGNLQAGALLMVAAVDMGGVPVGALIWMSEMVELTVEKLPTDKPTPEGFRIIANRYGESCSPVSVEIHILADGMVVAGRQRLGKLR